jgi:hypothetical protein
MPKINDVLTRETPLPRLQQAVLDYFENHEDEVFSWNKDELGQLAASVKKCTTSSIGWSIWALHKKGRIDREKVGRRFYYGSPKAVSSLREKANGKRRGKSIR